MSVIRFEIRYADGRTEIATVEGERALIGHGAHCDVRLPIDQAAPEHIGVEVVGGTVRVETKAFDPPATVNGMTFTSMPIHPDMPLKLATTRIFISLAEEDARLGGPVAQKDEGGGSPVLRLAGVIAAAGGLLYLFMPAEAAHQSAPMSMPTLFAEKAPPCEQQAPDQALALARSKLDVAEARRERSPFVAKDGLQAVQYYDIAAECFRQANAPAEMDEAKRAADQLRESITLDFRARRVRLEHMLAVGDYELAAKDVAVLRTLTENQKGPWVNWLASVDQSIKQRGSTK